MPFCIAWHPQIRPHWVVSCVTLRFIVQPLRVVYISWPYFMVYITWSLRMVSYCLAFGWSATCMVPSGWSHIVWPVSLDRSVFGLVTDPSEEEWCVAIARLEQTRPNGLAWPCPFESINWFGWLPNIGVMITGIDYPVGPIICDANDDVLIIAAVR